MTAIQLQAEYQDLVSIIAEKADLVIDPRISAMTKGIIPPDSYNYKE